MKKIPKSEEEWKKVLTPEQYRIMRQKGTEAPFSGRLFKNAEGTFACAACGQMLFASSAKFDSATGWPSFDESLPGAIELRPDNSHSMNRTEVVCSRCKSHLGHLFDDGPTKTGKRYCLNSVCLDLK